jgi:hypothetical protein
MKMNSSAARSALAVAIAAAFASSAFAAGSFIGEADNSQSRFGGDGYAYFHEDAPSGSKSVTPFRVANPRGLSDAQYAALSSDDPQWQPRILIDKAIPAADPLPRPATKVEKLALFKSENQFLARSSTP